MAERYSRKSLPTCTGMAISVSVPSCNRMRARRSFPAVALLSVLLSFGVAAPARAQACRDQPVIMLAASWCGFCRQARKFFNAHDVEFTEIDVEKTDHADIQRLYRENGVPVIFVGSEQVKGFDEPQLRELLCIED